jgi:hypothetical protein
LRCIPKGKLAYLLTGEEKIMNINDRLDNLSKGELISLIKEIKITCESNNSVDSPIRNTLNFILRLIKGEI